jgi:hypothetical protein
MPPSKGDRAAQLEALRRYVSALGTKPGAQPPAQPNRPLWRRTQLLAAGLLAAALALGVLVGAASSSGKPTAAQRRAAAAASVQTTPPAPTAPSGDASVGQPPACLAAVEAAEQVISYLVGNLRDKRLSNSLQEFVRTRQACLQASTR